MSDKTDYHRGYTPELPAQGGTGTVTSVALNMPAQFTVTGSPVTSAGTLNASWVSQTQRLFFASPNSGSGAPGFRAILATDLPDLSGQYQPRSSTLDDLALGSPNVSFSNTSLFRRTYVLPNVDATILTDANAVTVPQGGTGLTSLTTGNYLRAASPTTLQQRTPAQVRADIGAGTVTSVALSPPTGMSVSGSPITGGGTLNLSWSSQPSRRFLASPLYTSGPPVFREIDLGDIPPPGDDGEIVYVRAGLLGTDSDFRWSEVNKTLHLGPNYIVNESSGGATRSRWVSPGPGNIKPAYIEVASNDLDAAFVIDLTDCSLVGYSSGWLGWNGHTLWHQGNDGDGSGLDADLLDGQQGSYYLNWNNMSGTLPVSKGGTGQTTLALARNAMGLGNTTGALPIANGGTGASNATSARNNLGLGSAATRDVPTSGDATATQVVLGNDSRLSAGGAPWGAYALRRITRDHGALATGNNNNVNFIQGDASVIRLQWQSNSILTGISGGQDGMEIFLYWQAVPAGCSILNNSGLSLPANRIRTPGGANITPDGFSMLHLIYSGFSSNWYVV